AHAGGILWDQRANGEFTPSAIIELVLSRPENLAFLRQLNEWHETIGSRYSIRILGTEALWKNSRDQIPPHMKSYWNRLEPSARKQVQEVEDSYRRYRDGNNSVTADTLCSLIGKTLELQLRHTIIE